MLEKQEDTYRKLLDTVRENSKGNGRNKILDIKILILSGVVLALEVSEWPSLSPPFYEEGQTQERN